MRALRVLRAGGWDPVREVDCVRLDFDLRHRRRITLHTEAGAHLLLDLPQTVHLRDGEGLECEDGAIVRVHAHPEPLLELTAVDAAELARLAWHLGNRHLPVQVLHGALRIRDDHVIAGMIEALGGTVRHIAAAFDPEPGAYAAEPGRHHHHDDA
ncbi:MAG: urease accessory protein UreE [Proteobacteria bacterium]|nr:urease accessory protein UreE [Pseudomonadota bacterium]